MQTEKLKPLPKRITNEIRKILESCRDGKLKHDQSNVHCGSAHCICGWKWTLDAAKTIGDGLLTAEFGYDLYLAPEQANGYDLSVAIERQTRDAWGYSQIKWKLTDTEADKLFDGTATFSEQFKILEALERGERFADPRI